jgi:hypothetical protein
MTRALALLLLVACSPSAERSSRLIPRFAIDPAGNSVPLGTYYDAVTQRTCEARESGAGFRCVPVAEYAQVLYRAPTCTGPGLSQSVLVKDVYLRAADRDELYTPCRTADPLLGLSGSWYLMPRPGSCVQVTPDSLASTIQVCPVDMTQFPLTP